jgi:cytochrome c-type biogenesis protein CcsB
MVSFMTPPWSLLLISALVLYGVATTLYVAHLLSRKPVLAVLAGRALFAGLALHGTGKVAGYWLTGGLPVATSTEVLNLLALVIGFVFLLVSRRYGVPVLGAFATPLALVTLAASIAFDAPSSGLPESLRSAWLPVHLSFAIGADALLAVAGVTSVAYLVQERMLRTKRLGVMFRNLPPLHLLDEVVHRLLVLGWLLMTFGIVAGAFFAKQQWGAYWSWDPRQTWSLLTWCLFAAILHARVTVGWRGRRAAYLTLVAVVLVLAAIPALAWLTHTRHGGDFA